MWKRVVKQTVVRAVETRCGDKPLPAAGEETLTNAMTEAGKTYEEIALLVAEQVGVLPGSLAVL